MKKITLFLALSIFINAEVDYEADIQPIWDNNCSSCHTGGNPSGQLDLGAGSWNNLVNISSANYAPALRVVPYEPNNSVLYHKIFYTNQSGNGMPPNSAGGQLPLSERQLVEQWINEGAPATGGGVGPTTLEFYLPDGTYIWYTGTEEIISWYSTTTGGDDYPLNIELYNVDEFYQNLATNILSSGTGGSFDWSIPSDLPIGGNYQIKLWHPDYTTEATSNYFQINDTGGGSNGRIWGQITLDEEWGFGQVNMKLNLPGGNFIEQGWDEDPPFSDISFSFEDPQITEGGPYEVVVYFDGNSNNLFDGEEPYAMINGLYVDASLELGNIDLTLVSGSGTGGGYSFSIEGQISVPFPYFDSGSELTIEMYIKHFEDNDDSFILFERQNWATLEWDGNNYEFIFYVYGVGSAFWNYGSPLPVGEWHHIAVAYSDDGHLKIFWDGELKQDFSAGHQPLGNGTSELEVGNHTVYMDEFRISDIALYNVNFISPSSPYSGNETNTHLLWHFDEGGGNTIIDASGQGNDGYPAGIGYWYDDEPWGEGSAGPTFIEITTPNSSTNWSAGTGESIEWSSTTSDGMVYIVDIELWKGGSYYETIDAVWQSSSSGDSYGWSIPEEIPEGNDYEVRVVHFDSGVDDYSDYFQISGGGGTDNGKIAGEILVERTIGGTIYVDLYFPGSVMNEDPPDMSIPSVHVDLTPGIGWYYEFPDLPDGNGYTVQCLIDADGSPNTGTGNCDAAEDLQGTIQNIVIFDGSQENGDIGLEECSGDDYPTISNFAVTSGDAYVNSSDVYFSIELAAASGLDSVQYYYYQGGDNTDITKHMMTVDGSASGTWNGSIVAGDVTMEGLMVKISAKSNDGYEQLSNWFEIPVYFNEYGYDGLPHKQYTMVSFPGDLDNDNVKSVIENSLGAYDPAVWRSFSYNSSTGSYDENSGNFKAGRAVWVITSETSNGLDGGSGKVTSLENPYTISLNQGWNMIGNPYAFNVDLTNHISASGDVEMTLYKYDGNGYVSKTDMTPGDGYWIWSNEEGASLEFDHKPSGGSQKQMTGGWQFNLSAVIYGYHDSENRLGTHPLADDERDGMDAHEPPVIGDYVQLAFDNTDWTDEGIYSKDIRKEGQSSYTWDVDVKSNIAGQISINGLNTSYIPSEYDAVLIDLENRVQHNLRSGEVYNYVSIGAEQPHNFQVIVGLPENVSKSIESLGILPTEFSVDQNVPNPFNPITSIRVQLVEDARVTMKIFNILGEEVLTLIDNEFMKSGHRQVIWNGRDNFNRQLPSGLYLYQTVILNNQGKLLYMNTNKMIMVK